MERHITVLEHDAVKGLNLFPGARVVDATLGSGGHATHILKHIGESGTFIGIDADQTALDAASGRINASGRHHLVCENFRNIDRVLKKLEIQHVDAILADLGWRIEQFESGGRGFSFRKDEPLLMTYGDPNKYAFTAKDIVNEWEESDIKNVIKGYGEERFAGRIARAVIDARESKEIVRSKQLADIIEHAVPRFYKTGTVHPATRTFQALRITVNDELDALTEFLGKAIDALAPSGRLVVITFHSLEDRIVKRAFRAYAENHIGTVVTKKPIQPSVEELKGNPRARSAKMRIFERVHEIQDKENGISR